MDVNAGFRYNKLIMETQSNEVHSENIEAIKRVMLSGEEISSIPIPYKLDVIFFKSGGGNHLYLI